jgi:hypothetical protein
MVHLLPLYTDEEAAEEASLQECSNGLCGTEDYVLEDEEML